MITELPDKHKNKYTVLKTNYRQIKSKINSLEDAMSRNSPRENDIIILDILKDIKQILKVMNGIHKDDQ